MCVSIQTISHQVREMHTMNQGEGRELLRAKHGNDRNENQNGRTQNRIGPKKKRTRMNGSSALVSIRNRLGLRNCSSTFRRNFRAMAWTLSGTNAPVSFLESSSMKKEATLSLKFLGQLRALGIRWMQRRPKMFEAELLHQHQHGPQHGS